jgi:NH3-dependent NAD+ synthetase
MMPVLNPAALIDYKVSKIQEFHTTAHAVRAEIDVSGGHDSAVVMGLLAKALGPKNVTACFLGIDSNPVSLERARLAAQAFGVNLIEYNFTDLFHFAITSMKNALYSSGVSPEEIDRRIAADPTILGSIRSTMRAPLGRGFNRLMGGGIRHGTGNEDEDRVIRFYQKGGDGEVDCGIIGMLSKGETYQIGLKLGVPRDITLAKPSPDLWGTGESHNDEDEIASFMGLSEILKGHPGMSMYSYVDPETGAYSNVGILERLARFLDVPAWKWDSSAASSLSTESTFFGTANIGEMLKFSMSATECASAFFPELEKHVLAFLLGQAWRVERMTRHKAANLPQMGTRQEMLDLGLLTNDLPL